MYENPGVQPLTDAQGTWIPSTTPGNNLMKGGGISGRYWYCNGRAMESIANLPPGSMHFRTYSIYYNQGFWISDCDASRTDVPASPWKRLSFDYNEQDFSSHLTIAGSKLSLGTQRANQEWPDKLLPNIYHAQRSSWTADEHERYGGLTGELPILLGLIAFSISEEHSAWAISACFADEKFKVHSHPNRYGWVPGRGMVVRVYTCPGQNPSTCKDLQDFEEGAWGNYFD